MHARTGAPSWLRSGRPGFKNRWVDHLQLLLTTWPWSLQLNSGIDDQEPNLVFDSTEVFVVFYPEQFLLILQSASQKRSFTLHWSHPSFSGSLVWNAIDFGFAFEGCVSVWEAEQEAAVCDWRGPGARAGRVRYFQWKVGVGWLESTALRRVGLPLHSTTADLPRARPARPGLPVLEVAASRLLSSQVRLKLHAVQPILRFLFSFFCIWKPNRLSTNPITLEVQCRCPIIRFGLVLFFLEILVYLTMEYFGFISI